MSYQVELKEPGGRIVTARKSNMSPAEAAQRFAAIAKQAKRGAYRAPTQLREARTVKEQPYWMHDAWWNGEWRKQAGAAQAAKAQTRLNDAWQRLGLPTEEAPATPATPAEKLAAAYARLDARRGR